MKKKYRVVEQKFWEGIEWLSVIIFVISWGVITGALLAILI